MVAKAKAMRLAPRYIAGTLNCVGSADPGQHYTSGQLNIGFTSPYSGCKINPSSSQSVSAASIPCSEIEGFVHFSEPLLPGEVMSVEAAIGAFVYHNDASNYQPVSSAVKAEILTEDWDPAALTWNNKPSATDAALDLIVSLSSDLVILTTQAISTFRWPRSKFLTGGPWYGIRLSMVSLYTDHGSWAEEPYATITQAKALICN